ncbi:MAG: CoA transferase [SAR202 cluster bacterium]|nr:CoA transferase [SAR202 cluster bacterium]MQG70502.1 CoA transferase [SAR202 cluster bacterium]|tara:strand:+ start:1385 stop:2656 length:1272 start_codon:yes stop_codon:yes gene_type:complete
MPGALDGIKILEFTQIIAGPFGGMMLSDMGADVIKVEPLQGEPWRLARQFIPGESKTFMSLNRGKRSLPLDLTKPKAMDIVRQMIPEVDVIIINARPDVPEKLGIDFETLAKINPRLIYCDNTAFGRNGPHAYRPGYDLIVQAISGLMASEGKIQDGVPQLISSTAVADFATGIAIAWGVCAALYVRERTGKGQKIDTNLLGTALAVQTGSFMEVAAIDTESRQEFTETLAALREGGASYEEMDYQYRSVLSPWRGGNIYYRTYAAKDGVFAIACLSDHLRRRAADILGIDDPRFEAGYDPFDDQAIAAGEALVPVAEELFKQRTVDEWLTEFDKVGVPAGPVRFVPELMDDEQVTANNLIVDLEHSLAGSVRMVGPMINMSDTPLEAQSASPALGEHTDEILSGLGFQSDEIQTLRDDGVTR